MWPGVCPGTVPTHVVDVQMRVHDHVDVLRRDAVTCELGEEDGLRFGHERTGLRPDSRVDQQRRPAVTHEHCVDRQPPALV
jgi:hypothetical protein